MTSNASAQQYPREEVRPAVILAVNNSSRHAAPTSYPDGNSVYVQQFAHLKQHSRYGFVANDSGTGATEPVAASEPDKRLRDDTTSTCVGPASFCSTYFGS
ncbi:DUF4148 domain-containing protein [Burkholderia pyrrocinia]